MLSSSEMKTERKKNLEIVILTKHDKQVFQKSVLYRQREYKKKKQNVENLFSTAGHNYGMTRISNTLCSTFSLRVKKIK